MTVRYVIFEKRGFSFLVKQKVELFWVRENLVIDASDIKQIMERL